MKIALHCPVCQRVSAAPAAPARCPHCDTLVHHRRPGSLARSAALGLAAVFVLVPAYTLPVMSIQRLGHFHADTIFTSVQKLWQQGMWGIALIVFAASLVVPLFKLTSLGFLLAAVRWPGLAPAPALTRLHGVVHFIGRWSMLDVFLVAFLCGLVRFDGLARVDARPGAIAFAAAVILTMLATAAFDPRLIGERLPASSGRTRPTP
ncbi:MAG TPA: paraquat-inducible protein A [Lacunisphaera sp.]|nr:paraquat-inducible protein A [Lacunisphaera sp.]